MPQENLLEISIATLELKSVFLDRIVLIDCYIMPGLRKIDEVPVLLINDGQDLRTMQYENILSSLLLENKIQPFFSVGIHCAKDRKNEYGTAEALDYKGRGAKAGLYHLFVMEELLPFLRLQFNIVNIKEMAFAGFSLGGLSALDIVWNYPEVFSKAAIFSGSFWWRDKDHEDVDFDEDKNRIMHRSVREGKYYAHLKFFFEVGTLDEVNDRNNNGIIDSIDDTLSLIAELTAKGYNPIKDINYLELPNGRHDVATWAKAFPVFLTWAWGK